MIISSKITELFGKVTVVIDFLTDEFVLLIKITDYAPNENIVIELLLFPKVALNFVDIDIPMHHGIYCKCRHTLHTQLFHDILAVRDNSGQSDVELVGNFLVNIPLHNKRQHLDLPAGQFLDRERLGHIRQVPTLSMGMLFEHQKRTHELVFR